MALQHAFRNIVYDVTIANCCHRVACSHLTQTTHSSTKDFVTDLCKKWLYPINVFKNQFSREETNGDSNTSPRLFCLRYLIWPECDNHFQSIGQSSMVETASGLMWRRWMQRKFQILQTKMTTIWEVLIVLILNLFWQSNGQTQFSVLKGKKILLKTTLWHVVICKQCHFLVSAVWKFSQFANLIRIKTSITL